MPQKLTAEAAWTDVLDVPRDGEAIDAADVNTPLARLLGNDMHLYALTAQINQGVEELKRSRGGFQMTVPPAITLEPGQNYTIPNAVQVGRYEGWGGQVTLQAQNLPAGVTATFNPNPLPSDDADADLILQAGIDVVAGPYDVTVLGVSDDNKTDSVRMRLDVLAETAKADFTFLPSAVSVSLDRAAGVRSQTLSMQVERAGQFAEDVTFAVTNLPAGMTQTWSKNPVTGSAALEQQATNLTLQVTDAVPTGSYSLNIRASGGGIVRTQAVQVAVGAVLTADAGFTLRLEYDPGDPYLTNGATIHIDRNGGYAGPVTLRAQDFRYLGLWWWPFDDRQGPLLLINGQPLQAVVTGNMARVTADGVSRGWRGAGVAPRGTRGRMHQTIIKGEATVGGKTITRTVDVNVRLGSRMY